MKTLITLFTLSVLIFIGTGCSSKKRVVVAVKSLPTWYAKPAQSTPNTLYSVGEGENKSEALANALSNMASSLSVSISSEFSMQSRVREGSIKSIQRDSVSKVSSQVEALRISNYKVIHTKEYGFQRYLIAIQAEKEKIFSSLLKEIDQELDIIQTKYEESFQYDTLKQLSFFKQATIQTQTLKNTVLVMNILDSKFDDTLYLDKLLEIQNRYDTLHSQITFSIQADRNSEKLRTVISNGLSLEGYKMRTEKQDKNHFIVDISSKVSRAKSYGFDLARSAISIRVLNYNETICGSNKLNITGQSTQGYEIAKENVAVKLQTMLKKEGIGKIIGLEL